ncbi:hypothetical protein JCM18237_01010 [Halorubrum luteum]
MRSLLGGVPHCKRCGAGLDGDEDQCSNCGFSPRQMGLRVSLSFLFVSIVSMTVVMAPASIGIEPLLVGAAALSFLLAILLLLVSFIVTPYRFGSLFARF